MFKVRQYLFFNNFFAVYWSVVYDHCRDFGKNEKMYKEIILSNT